jgi:hypothetical protein
MPCFRPKTPSLDFIMPGAATQISAAATAISFAASRTPTVSFQMCSAQPETGAVSSRMDLVCTPLGSDALIEWTPDGAQTRRFDSRQGCLKQTCVLFCERLGSSFTLEAAFDTPHPMKRPDKKHLLKWNTILWLAAMALPAFFSIALASTKFPWPILVPLLLLGPMLASNKMLVQAFGEETGSPMPERPNA